MRSNFFQFTRKMLYLSFGFGTVDQSNSVDISFREILISSLIIVPLTVEMAILLPNVEVGDSLAW